MDTSKSILLIGANGGLGSETTKCLIQDGYTDITMACRTEIKGIKAVEAIIAETKMKNSSKLTVYGGFDMNHPNKIKAAIANLPRHKQYDAIFLAAGGVFFTDDYQTNKWNGLKVEKTIFQNLIGAHICLTELKKSNLIAPKARVMMSGGEGSRGIKGMIDKPVFTNPKELNNYFFAKPKGRAPYNPMNAIGTSKLLGAIWVTKVAELEKGNFNIVWFTPGLTYGTGGLDGMPPVKRWFMQHVGFGMMRAMGQAQSPKDGGRKFADCLEGKIGKNGDILGSPEGKSIGETTDQKPMNTNFTDPELREELWKMIEQVYEPYPETITA